MQIRDEHLVVVGGLVVGVVVVAVVGDAVVVVVVVVDVVVLSPDDGADEDDDTPLVVVATTPFDWEAGGIGSTAPNSDGSCSVRSVPSASEPNAKSVQVIAPTTAPTASRP